MVEMEKNSVDVVVVARQWVDGWKNKDGQYPRKYVSGQSYETAPVTENDIDECIDNAILEIKTTPIKIFHLMVIGICRRFSELGLSFLPGDYGPAVALAILEEARHILRPATGTLKIA